MKKTNTSNPLKFFNDAKAARNKSLVKAQDGRIGPMTQQEAAAETAATSYPGPYAIPSVKDQIIKSMSRPSFPSPIDELKNNTQRVNNIEYEKGSYSNSGAMQARSKDLDNYKKQVGTYNQNLMKDSNRKKGGTHKMPNGKIMLNSKMKMGGTTKATKFAALAPPYNKATAADRIAGAKKNAKKK